MKLFHFVLLMILLYTGSVLTFGAPTANGNGPESENTEGKRRDRILLIDTTDLYFPGQDIGDSVDLIAPYALPEIDLRAVILDVTEDFRLENGLGRDMGIIPVTQLNYLFDKNVPCAPSPFTRMKSPEDTMTDVPEFQQSGIRLLLETLRASDEKMEITAFGSARTIAVAFNREPGLLREKVRRVHLNIGCSGNNAVEWNVALDPYAFTALLTSGLPLALYPCAAANRDGSEIAAFCYDETNSYWQMENLAFIAEMDPPLRRYLEFAFTRDTRSDFLRAMEMDRDPPLTPEFWNRPHNVWETAVWLCMTGRRLVRRADGSFRILLPDEVTPSDTILPNELRPCRLRVEPNGLFTFEYSEEPTGIEIYYRGDPRENERALREAWPLWYRGFSVKKGEKTSP